MVKYTYNINDRTVSHLYLHHFILWTKVALQKKWEGVRRIVNIPKKQVLIILALVLVVGSGIIVYKHSGAKKQSEQASSNKVAVQVQPAKTMESTSALSLKANLAPVEKGIVGSKMSGQVVRILFEDGDMVSQGQALIALDDQDLRNQLQSAEINLQKLQATLDSSQRSFDRSKALFDSGAVSKSTIEDAETALKLARASVDAEQVSIQSINNSLNNSVLRAPISGEVDEKNVSLGQYVSPGTVLATVKNTTSIKAVVQIKQSDLDKVKVGQKATLKLSKDNADTYEGIVKNIDASADSSSRVFDCQIEIDNTAGKLRSGVFGYIEIANEQKKEILAIPLAALVGNEGSYSAFTMEENVARKHSVSIGEIQNDMVEVITGIKAGENVIVSNLNVLQDGDAVELEGQGI